jgi:hypothetical protein
MAILFFSSAVVTRPYLWSVGVQNQSFIEPNGYYIYHQV